MAKGIIKENIGGGYYKVEVVFERQRIDDEVAALTAKKSDLEAKLAQLEGNEKKSVEMAIASIEKRLIFLNNYAPENFEVNCYCADFSDTMEPDAVVGLIEIGRQFSYKILIDNVVYGRQYYVIQPNFDGGAAYNASRDGIAGTALSVSAAGFAYNYAVSTGAMRWRPRYRAATITAINGNAADITLEDMVYIQLDSQAQVDIDDTSKLTLAGVSIDYMDCDGLAFEVGDEVVVKWNGPGWTNPLIIGFTGPPKECQEVRYYAAGFAKNYGATLPISYTELFQKLYFKITSDGAIQWVTEGEAQGQCNVDDCWKATTIKPYSNIFYWFHDAGLGWIINQSYTAFYCPAGLHPAGEPNPPSNLGVFDILYPSETDCLPWIGNGAESGVLDYYYRYTVDGRVFTIWASKIAVGISTGFNTVVTPKRNVRKVLTEVWRKETTGSYSVVQTNSQPLAIPRHVGGTGGLCAVTVPFLSWPVTHSLYRAKKVNTTGPFNMYSPGFWPDYIPIYQPEKGYYRDFFDINEPEYDTWWDSFVEYGSGPPGRTSTTLAQGSGVTWDSGGVGLNPGIKQSSYEGNAQIDKYGNAVGAMYTYSTAKVYHAPADDPQDGYASTVIGGQRPRGNFTTTIKTTVTQPTCFTYWTNQTETQDGSKSAKRNSEFPVQEVANYSEGAPFIYGSVYKYVNVAGSGENISRVAWMVNPNDENYLFLFINYIQTDDNGIKFYGGYETRYDKKYLVAVVSRITGEIISVNSYVGEATGGADVTDEGQYIFNETYFNPTAYADAMEAKRAEIGANSYHVFYLVRK